jgi:endonuclease III
MPRLETVLDSLARTYGEPTVPRQRTLLELVLIENVAYLVDDERREQAFDTLREQVGTSPSRILAASDAALLRVARSGILAEHQADKLRRIAQLAMEAHPEDVRTQPLRQAKRALMRFPSIGEPGAEKILLLARSHPVLGLDSNGVRVLTRLGLVEEAKTYSATYRAVQRFAAQYAARGFDWLIRAHQLLRQHGQELCRRSRPRCAACPLSDGCAFYTGIGWPSADTVSPR